MHIKKPLVSFGARRSILTGNELKHSDYAGLGAIAPAQTFAISYDFPHYNQNQLGICTAIDLADMLQKVYGIPFSPQFIYNLGKKLYDKDLDEGSSILTMVRVVNNYGAAPLSFVPTDDTTKNYEEYVEDWFTPEAFAEALKYKMNYATARLDPLGFASDLSTSKYGLMTIMQVGEEWYTNKAGQIDYKDDDIDPLRAPHPVTGGHSIKVIEYQGLDINQLRTLRNTWGDKDNPIMPGDLVWGDNGDIHYIYQTLKPYVLEAWSISLPIPGQPIGLTFSTDLKLGMTSTDVCHLQVYLNNHGFPVALTGPGSAGKETDYFGNATQKALAKFQAANGISPALGNFGPITRAFVNSHE